MDTEEIIDGTENTDCRVISTTVTAEHWRMRRENKWQWSELIRLGVAAKQKPEVLVHRVKAMEEKLNEFAQIAADRERKRLKAARPMTPEEYAARFKK